MDICFYDYETYYSVEHSLTRMNPIEYIMHPDTEIQSLSIKWNKYPTEVFFGEERIRQLLTTLQAKGAFDNAMMVAHNGSGFDHLISAWRFGIKPKAWGCTLAMSKPFYGVSVGGSLKKVSAALGLGMKGDLEAINTKGKKFREFLPEQIASMREYNKQDTELCAGIFYALAPQLTTKELKLIDLAIRMTVEEKFEADTDLLQRTLERVQSEKEERLLSLHHLCVSRGIYDRDDGANPLLQIKSAVMSQQKFAALLDAMGQPVPLKMSNTTGKPIPALAKSDKGMQQLLESENEDVALAAAVRLETKSTQLETRLQTYLTVAKARGGKLPMPVNYCGAAISWRMSGGMKMNVQNNPRVERHKVPKGHPLFGVPTDKAGNSLRLSLKAPKGKLVVVADSSNIELRVAHKLAGQEDTIEKLRNKEDLYCWFASDLFGREITKADESERFIGKVAMLSLQYGASWASFQNMSRVLSSGKVDLPESECRRIVSLWRGRFQKIAGRQGIWQQCKKAIEAMASGDQMVLTELNLYTAYQQLIVPEGRWLQYPDLHEKINPDTGYTEWEYGQGQNKSRIHGAHLFENVCVGATTEVLTMNGWKRVIEVSAQDRVWDGVEWVQHDGLSYNGVKKTINFGGVRMTPDHEVLIGHDWIEAQHTTHEQATASYREARYVTPPCVRGVSLNAGQVQPKGGKEPVYDLINAGPRHRFVVRGDDGQPFIVHNCQHIARNIVMEQTLVLDKLYPGSVALTCHDEVVLVVDEDKADDCKQRAIEVFSTAPHWWPSLPLGAEAGVGRTYGEAK